MKRSGWNSTGRLLNAEKTRNGPDTFMILQLIGGRVIPAFLRAGILAYLLLQAVLAFPFFMLMYFDVQASLFKGFHAFVRSQWLDFILSSILIASSVILFWGFVTKSIFKKNRNMYAKAALLNILCASDIVISCYHKDAWIDVFTISYYIFVWNIIIFSFVFYKSIYLYAFKNINCHCGITGTNNTLASSIFLACHIIVTCSLIIILVNAIFYFFTQHSFLPFFP